MADAGDLYMSWRWLDGSATGGIAVVPEDQLTAVLAEFDAALPDPTVAGGVLDALIGGAFASYDAEHALAQRLSQALLPQQLAAELAAEFTSGARPHLRIQPSPRVAQIPWELLDVDFQGDANGLRLLEIADISLLAPASVVHAAGRVAQSWSQTRQLPIVGVLDPRVPGFRADSSLGSVLGRMTADAPVAQRVAEHAAHDRLRPAVTDSLQAFRREDLDREWLGIELRSGASRLLYVGHVTAAPPESGRSENAQMHLACNAGALGFAPVTREHRPLSAKDLLLGTHTLAADPASGRELWPIPSRVALIACESGGDLRFGEALGLVSAMIHGGAELVTASRWSLPTDLAFDRAGGTHEGVRPLQDAICAIDAAHESDDPVQTLATWQRERLSAWREYRTLNHSPVLWAAFATTVT